MNDNDAPTADGLTEERRQAIIALGSKARAESCRADFVETQNPMCAFEAFLIHQKLGDAIPEWILEYFHRSISEFWGRYLEFRKQPERIAAHIARPQNAFAESFGIIASSSNTIWDHHSLNAWDYRFGICVFLRLWRGISKEGVAVDDVAAHFKTSSSTVGRAWRRFKRANPILIQTWKANKRAEGSLAIPQDALTWGLLSGLVSECMLEKVPRVPS